MSERHDTDSQRQPSSGIRVRQRTPPFGVRRVSDPTIAPGTIITVTSLLKR